MPQKRGLAAARARQSCLSSHCLSSQRRGCSPCGRWRRHCRGDWRWGSTGSCPARGFHGFQFKWKRLDGWEFCTHVCLQNLDFGPSFLNNLLTRTAPSGWPSGNLPFSRSTSMPFAHHTSRYTVKLWSRPGDCRSWAGRCRIPRRCADPRPGPDPEDQESGEALRRFKGNNAAIKSLRCHISQCPQSGRARSPSRPSCRSIHRRSWRVARCCQDRGRQQVLQVRMGCCRIFKSVMMNAVKIRCLPSLVWKLTEVH